MRLDQALVKWGLAPSRTKAQELIENGSVEVHSGSTWKTAKAASDKLSEQENKPENLRLKESELLKYVSRGGLKLESALRHLRLNVKDWICLDCGQSTGGFTDCLLQEGAAKVVGFDVGQAQLHEKLQKDSRVLSFENLHLKDAITKVELLSVKPAGGFDLIVADLSFIPAEKTLPFFATFGNRLLLLVKPQFEVGAENLTKKGLVKDPSLYEKVRERVIELARAEGWNVLDYFPSGVEGRDGNREFFLFATKKE